MSDSDRPVDAAGRRLGQLMDQLPEGSCEYLWLGQPSRAEQALLRGLLGSWVSVAGISRRGSGDSRLR